MRLAAVFVAIVIIVAVERSTAMAAGNSPDQATPTARSSPSGVAPPRELTLEQRADIFMARKNYAEAADYYYRALKQSTFKDPMLWNKLGIALQQENEFRKAHNAYTNATRVDRNFAEGWNNIGTLYFMVKKYGKSVKYYQRAIEIKGDTAAFHMNLGTSYYHLKKYEEAVAEYRTALKLDPKVTVRQSALGTVIHAGATDVDFYFYMAKAFASTGDAEDAVRYLRRALEDGFNGRERMQGDPDFQKISQDPAYIELMQHPPASIKD